MSKRAAIIITDADRITGQGYEGEGWRAVSWFSERTSEKLLADLRTLVDETQRAADLDSALWTDARVKHVQGTLARVRALLPEEES